MSDRAVVEDGGPTIGVRRGPTPTDAARRASETRAD
jgi:hypothetical protein